MLKTYILTKAALAEQPQLEGAIDLARQGNGILWVDVRSYSEVEINQIAQVFSLHPVEIDSLQDDYTRPHIYEYGDHFHANFTCIDWVNGEVVPHEFHVFLGKDYNHMRNYSESIASAIDGEINSLIKHAYDRTNVILTEHVEKLHKIAKYLLAEEKIDGPKFLELMTEQTFA